MLKRVTWRLWLTIAIAIGIYISLGFWLDSNGAFEGQLYKWGLLTASLAPLLLIIVYTLSGNKWWANDVGSAIVQVKLCVILLAAPLAWVFWVNHGILLPGFLAWIEVSAPALVTLAIMRLCWVFLRIHRDDKNGKMPERQ